MKIKSDTLTLLFAAGTLGLVSMVAFGSDGPVRAEFKAWRAEREQRKVLRAYWPELTSGARLDRGGGPVAIVEFADYQCPYCREMHGRLMRLVQEREDIGIVYRHLPLPIHRAAEPAARAAICAEAQDFFLQMHNHLLETVAWYEAVDWEREAQSIGIPNPHAFGECLTSEETSRRLELDRELANRLGFSSTPSFATRSNTSIGAMSETELLDFLDLR